MERRKFLQMLLYTAAAAYLAPVSLATHTVEAASMGNSGSLAVDIEETYLRFKSLTNRERTDMLIIHHIGNTNRDVSAAEVHQWHLHNGWAGIGYHYLIRKNGMIERGRPRDTIGAHCYGENRHTIGINIVGNFETNIPTNAQMEAAARLVARLCQLYRLRPGEHTILGHRDFNDTLCPGQYLYDLLPELRQQAANLLGV